MPNWNVGASFRGFQGHREVAAEMPQIDSYSFRVLRDGAPQRIGDGKVVVAIYLPDGGSRRSKGQSIHVFNSGTNDTRAKQKRNITSHSVWSEAKVTAIGFMMCCLSA